MNFLKGKGRELVKLAAQEGIEINDETQFANLTERAAIMCSAQVQRWVVDSDCFEADAYVNEFTPGGDLSTRADQVLFTATPAQWMEIASGWVVIAETNGTFIVDMAELDDLLWCEALRREYGDESGFMKAHGFNLSMMLKHAPEKFLEVCKEAANRYTMATAERIFNESMCEFGEEINNGY